MAMSKGCTIALVVFAIFVLLLIIGLVVLWINKDKLVEAGVDYTINTVEKEINANMPPGYTPESVHGILTAFKAGIKSKEINAQETQQLATTFQAAMADKKIDATEGAHILEMIVQALPPGTVPTDSLPGQMPVDSLPLAPDSI